MKKGDLVSVWGWFLVVVEEVNGNIHCICDNANNIYSFKKEEVDYAFSLKDVVETEWCGHDSEDLCKLIKSRSIPWSVMVEVLSGKHDHRFGEKFFTDADRLDFFMIKFGISREKIDAAMKESKS